MLNLNHEEINEGRRQILRSSPALGAGILAPMGVLGSGLLHTEQALAATETVYGDSYAHPEQPHLTITHKNKKIRIETYQIKRNGKVIETYVMAFIGSSTGPWELQHVVRMHDISGTRHLSHYSGVTRLSNPSRIVYTTSSATSRRLKAHLGSSWLTDHDNDGKHAGTVAAVTRGLPNTHNVGTDWVSRGKEQRYISGVRKITTSPNPFINRGLCVAEVLDDKHTVYVTPWFGSVNNKADYLELTSLYAKLKAADDKVFQQNGALGGFIAGATVVWAGAMFGVWWIPIGTAPLVPIVLSIGILTVSALNVASTNTTAKALAVAERTQAAIDYCAFVRANLQSTILV